LQWMPLRFYAVTFMVGRGAWRGVYTLTKQGQESLVSANLGPFWRGIAAAW
jgi:hypothetical protein